MPQLIDLSHTVEAGMITYKGIPAPIICDYLSREASKRLYGPDTSFHIGKIDLVANTGTYLDSPFHRYAEGKDLSELPLGTVLLTGDGILEPLCCKRLVDFFEKSLKSPCCKHFRQASHPNWTVPAPRIPGSTPWHLY